MEIQEIKNFVESNRFFVTGGAGFIGSNIVGELVKLGAKEIVVYDDLSTGFEHNIKEFSEQKNFKFIKGSITDFEYCLEAMKGMDVVLHLAALGSVPRSIDNPLATNEVNVVGFLNVLNAARLNQVRKVVYSSSSSVYGDNQRLPKVEHEIGNPLSPYAVSKRTNELYAETFRGLYDMDIVGLRYFNVFGPKQNIKGPYAAVIPIFIQNLLKKEPCYINGDGKISRDFTFVSNVVYANLCAAKEDVNTDLNLFNVAMGDQLSLLDLYKQLEKQIQSGLSPIHREKRKGDIDSSLADISRAKRILKYQPNCDFEEGIQKTVNWYREHSNE